jgi:hypothetical protein
MSERFPTSGSIDLLLAKIEALIGLGAKFPANRGEVKADALDADYYRTLWTEVDSELANVRNAGFLIANPNLHKSLTALWAWCIGLGGPLGRLRGKPHEVYADTVGRLRHLKEVLSHADAPLEVQREFRESALRTNEIFVVMAIRSETEPFKTIARSAASAVGLTPVFIAEQEPENAISEAILSSIRRSTLVLCDLSFERPNCYFEAGFAKGAMRRALFSCRSDHNHRAHPNGEYRVHFDVDQLKITWWNSDNLSPATSELETRLRLLLHEMGLHLDPDVHA